LFVWNDPQYAALVDVVGSIFLAQLDDPPPRPSAAADALLAAEGRSLVAGEERASSGVVAEPLARYQRARWARISAAMDVDDARALASAAFTFFNSAAAALSIDAGACAAVVTRLAAMANDAEREVGVAIANAEALVRANRRRPAIKLSVAVDVFRWSLRAGGRTFLDASIVDLSLSRERHADTSGLTKLVIQEMDLDVPPPKPKAAGTAAAKVDAALAERAAAKAVKKLRGRKKSKDVRVDASGRKHVLARWDPHGAVEKGGDGVNPLMGRVAPSLKKPLVKVNARRAASPPEAPVWDAIEVSIQPFDLHVERSLYDKIISYAFPEKDRIRGGYINPKGHDAFERSFGIGMFDRGGGGGGGGGYVDVSRAAAATAAAAATSPASESEARRLLLGGGADDAAAPLGGDQPKAALPPTAATNANATVDSNRGHKTVVVHRLRVNEVLLKVSYDGKPRSFKNVRLLLDASTHTGFQGRWRELINNLKGNIVWSVLKSITGLQGRRLPGLGAVGRLGLGVPLGLDEPTSPRPTRVAVDGIDSAGSAGGGEKKKTSDGGDDGEGEEEAKSGEESVDDSVDDDSADDDSVDVDGDDGDGEVRESASDDDRRDDDAYGFDVTEVKPRTKKASLFSRMFGAKKKRDGGGGGAPSPEKEKEDRDAVTASWHRR